MGSSTEATNCERIFDRWRALSDEVQSGLNQAASFLMQNQSGGLWDANTVAVRILLRTCSNFHAARSLVSIDLVSEPRAHVRSIIESAFALVGLQNDSERFLEDLRNDAAHSSKSQRRFIMDNFELPNDFGSDESKNRTAPQGGAKRLNVRGLAEQGTYEPLYIAYLLLSESAVHLSARSLHRHARIEQDHSSWSYIDGKGTHAENAATLRHACLAGISVGIAISVLLNEVAINANFAALSERFGAMPETIGLLDQS